MQEITSLTSSPKQNHTLVLENNETAELKLYYSVRQQSWYFDIEYKNIKATCLKVVITPNALRQFKRLIPFGIAFISLGDVEPYDLEDFSSGRVQMYLLNADEVKQIEADVFNIEE